jgi:stringent starvation protein B
MHQWIVDSGMTPHIVVDVGIQGVDVPPGYAKDGKLVLNVSYDATQALDMAAGHVEFSARFGGVARHLFIPMDAVLAIYAHETGQGMIFGPEEEPPPTSPDETDGSASSKPDAPRKPSLKVIK